MNLFDPIYGSTEFAEIVGCTTENLRDWRRRGMEIGILTPHGGRYRYCKYDAIEWWIRQAIPSMFYDDDDIYKTSVAARHIGRSVLRRIRLSDHGHPYNAAFWDKHTPGDAYGRYMAMDGQLNCRLSDNAEEAMKLTPLSGGWSVIDCQQIADEIAGQVGSNFPELYGR